MVRLLHERSMKEKERENVRHRLAPVKVADMDTEWDRGQIEQQSRGAIASHSLKTPPFLENMQGKL